MDKDILVQICLQADAHRRQALEAQLTAQVPQLHLYAAVIYIFVSFASVVHRLCNTVPQRQLLRTQIVFM